MKFFDRIGLLVLFVAACLTWLYSGPDSLVLFALVGAATLPQTTRQLDPRKPPYKFLRIQMHGKALYTDKSVPQAVYRPLLLTFFYGPPPGVCNPPSFTETNKISLVQGQAAAGTTALVAGPPIVGGGALTAIAVTTAGAGYNPLVPPLVIITSSNGATGAYAVATVGTSGAALGTITGIQILNGSSYTVPYVAADTTITITAPNACGFQGMVANNLIENVFSGAWINNGIYADWFDTIGDKNLQVGSGTLVIGAVTGPGVVPDGGFLTPTGDGGVVEPRLSLDKDVTVFKYTGLGTRSWQGKAWHMPCVPITFATADDLNNVGLTAWDSIKACLYMPITDGVNVMYPIMVSQSNTQVQAAPTEVTWASLILPGLDPVRNVYNPLVSARLGEARRRQEKGALPL